MKKYAFDLETFPNFFSAVFISIAEEFDEYVFIRFEKSNDLNQLRQFISQPNLMLIGFNNSHFDDVILKYILKGQADPQELYKIAQQIINDDQALDKLNFIKLPYISVDLKLLLAIESSLKQTMVSLKWPKLQELPLPPETIINPGQVKTIIDYNFNDVGATKALYLKEKEEVDLRGLIGAPYGLDLWQASRSRVANLILEKEYAKQTGQHNFKDRNTTRVIVEVVDCIGKKIEFQTLELQRFLKKLSKMKLEYKDKFRFKEVVETAGKVFDMGVGGLHSRDEADIFKTNDTEQIIDADVASFYPNIILLNGIKPDHLDNRFLSIFEQMTKERLEAKAKGDKAKAEALKIVINSIFGKLGAEEHWLYDPLCFYSVTISGQLYLLSLIEALHLSGAEILSANTDGVTCRVKNTDSYYQTCKDWEQRTGFSLEYVTYQTYARRDVNNYICETMDRKVKEKGAFVTSIDVTKGYKFPVLSKALRAALIDDKDPEQFLRQHEDVFDFMSSQRTGTKFDIFQEDKRGEIQKLQKVNRYLVSTEGVRLYKEKGDGTRIELCAGEAVRVVNNYYGDPIQSFNIKYEFYLTEVNKILSKVRPSIVQEALF